MSDYDLQRFVTAQDGVYPAALEEIRRGRKTSHWMWFVFPQLRGLGASPTARFFAIGSLREAQAYLAHPLLGPRLRSITAALQGVAGATAEDVFGPVDARKLRSSLTLFRAADGGQGLFDDALGRWFAGEPDPLTVERLAAG